MKDRAERRKYENKVKAKMKTLVKHVYKNPKGAEDPKVVGKLASCHGAVCSCPMCGNPRKQLKQKTLAEKKASITAKEGSDS